MLLSAETTQVSVAVDNAAQITDIVPNVFDKARKCPEAKTPDRSIGSNAPSAGEHERYEPVA